MFVTRRTARRDPLVVAANGSVAVPVEDLNAVCRAACGIPDPKLIEPVELEVGEHMGCGGAVWYRSAYSDVAPVSERIGARHRPSYQETEHKAWCKRCGSAIVDPDMLQQFAAKVAAHRSRAME